MRIRILTSLVIAGGLYDHALAYSTAKTALNVEYSSYVRSNQLYFGGEEKADQMSTAGMSLLHENRVGRKHSKIDLKAFHSFAEDHSYINVGDLYADYSKSDTNIAFGRKRTNFSAADEFWQTGLWQPRFMWDRMLPETVGLTGFFVSGSQNSDTRMNFFVSPLYIPEESQKYEEKNGKITSRNPWFRPPPPKAEIFENITDVRAQVDEPKIEDVVSAFSLGVRVDHDINDSLTLGGSYGVKPVNQTVMGYRYKVVTANSEQYARINLVPSWPYEHIFTTDAATKNGAWHTLSSLTYDSPFKLDRDPVKITQQLQDMYVASFTMAYDLVGEGASATQLYGGIIKSWGALAADGGEDTTGTTQFEIRQRWFEAYRLGLKYPVWSKLRRLNNIFEVTYDRIQNGATLTSQAEYNFYDAWVATASLDLLGVFDTSISDYDTAFVRQYRANDRVSMGLSYVY